MEERRAGEEREKRLIKTAGGKKTENERIEEEQTRSAI